MNILSSKIGEETCLQMEAQWGADQSECYSWYKRETCLIDHNCRVSPVIHQHSNLCRVKSEKHLSLSLQRQLACPVLSTTEDVELTVAQRHRKLANSAWKRPWTWRGNQLPWTRIQSARAPSAGIEMKMLHEKRFSEEKQIQEEGHRNVCFLKITKKRE